MYNSQARGVCRLGWDSPEEQDRGQQGKPGRYQKSNETSLRFIQ